VLRLPCLLRLPVLLGLALVPEVGCPRGEVSIFATGRVFPGWATACHGMAGRVVGGRARPADRPLGSGHPPGSGCPRAATAGTGTRYAIS